MSRGQTIQIFLPSRLRVAFGQENAQFTRSLTKPRLSKSNRDHMQPFWAGESHDVWPLAYLIRNGVAHGSLTPTGMSLGTGDRLPALIALTEAVLQDSDEKFTSWVDRRIGQST